MSSKIRKIKPHLVDFLDPRYSGRCGIWNSYHPTDIRSAAIGVLGLEEFLFDKTWQTLNNTNVYHVYVMTIY